MRKLIALLLAFVMVCSLVACGESNSNPSNSGTQDNQQQEPTLPTGEIPAGSQSSDKEESSDQAHQETMSDEWGLSMDILFKTATEFDIVLTHSSIEATVHGTLTTSPEYEIRVIYNDEIISFHDYMTKVLGKTYADATPTWDTVLYTIPTDETFKIDAILNVQDENGGLPLGEYVLCKPVTLTTDNGEKIKKIFTKEFLVVEGVDTIKETLDEKETQTDNQNQSPLSNEEIIKIVTAAIDSASEKSIINLNAPDIQRITLQDDTLHFYKLDEAIDLNGKDVYKVTFRTTLDGLLGPIVYYVDCYTGQIYGMDYRE